MNFTDLENAEFYIEISYVTAIAVVLTIMGTGLLKIIMKKLGKLPKDLDSNVKDQLLATSGRIVALVIYAVVYLTNLFLTNETIVIDGALLAGLISGGTLTLTVAKGIYTSIRQMSKKKEVYQKLENAEKELKKIQANSITGKIILKGKAEER